MLFKLLLASELSGFMIGQMFFRGLHKKETLAGSDYRIQILCKYNLKKIFFMVLYK